MKEIKMPYDEYVSLEKKANMYEELLKKVEKMDNTIIIHSDYYGRLFLCTKSKDQVIEELNETYYYMRKDFESRIARIEKENKSMRKLIPNWLLNIINK